MSPKEISPEKPSCIQGQCGKVYSLRTLQNGLLSQGGGKTLPRRSLAHTGGSRGAPREAGAAELGRAARGGSGRPAVREEKAGVGVRGKGCNSK